MKSIKSVLFLPKLFGYRLLHNREYFLGGADLTSAKTLPISVTRGPQARTARQGFTWLDGHRQASGQRLKYRGNPAEVLEQSLLAHRIIMAFKPQSDNEDAMSEINVTPLVDVMLVLLIILLVTAPLLTQFVHVILPKTADTTADVEKQPLQLGIDEQGMIILNKFPMADLTALETALKDELAKNPEAALHLYADQAVVYAWVAEVMATVQHAGLTKIAFVTVEQ